MGGFGEITVKLRPHRMPGWTCSSCGELIKRIEDGWVEWLAAGEEEGGAVIKGLRLVHRDDVSAGCRYDAREEFLTNRNIVEGLPLARFVGPDGLMFLLSLLASGEIPRDEIIELTKRVQIPGYEQTRDLFHAAIENGLLSPSIGSDFYLQSEIQTVLHWVTRAA
jgi:hypothetical protein